MKRRVFLGTVGIGVTTIAGCTSRANPGEQPSGQTDSTPTDQPTTSEPTEGEGTTEHERVPTGETTEVTLGGRTLSEEGARSPHGIVLENPTDEVWTGQLLIHRPDDTVALDETYELEAGATVAVSLTDPLRYRAEATLPENEVSKTVDVDLAWFDCNASSTSFTIKPDGQLKFSTISTQMLCTNVETERVPSNEEISLFLGDGSLADDGDPKPHGVTVTNPTKDTWTTRLVIRQDDKPLLDGIYTLAPEATVSVTLTEVGDYQGTASIPSTGTSATFEVGSERFDCNHSSTNVTIGAEGTLDATTVSTMMACQAGTADGNGTADE